MVTQVDQLSEQVREQLAKAQALAKGLQAQIAQIEPRNRDLDDVNNENVNALVALEARVAEVEAIAQLLDPAKAFIASLKTDAGARLWADFWIRLAQKASF